VRRFIVLLLSTVIFNNQATCSDSLSVASTKNKKRVVIAGAFTGAATLGSLAGLSTVWYNTENVRFHTFDDLDEWKQMDKVGHIASTYNTSLILADLYRWSGVSDKRARMYSSSVAFLYMGVVEVFDGYSTGYGFSWTDILSNAIGCGSAAFNKKQRYFPQIKYSFRSSSYASLNPGLLGKTLPERMIKDYNGQTYWISIPGIYKALPWACVALGYGAEQMVNARDEQNRQLGYDPYRQYYLSLDIDLTRLKPQAPFLKALCSSFRFVKIPFPSLELSTGNVYFHALGW
jgi:hypothetical protein